MNNILDPNEYTIAWIAVLEIEAEAALNIINRHRGRFQYQRGDDYVYIGGDFGGYNIVLATLPEGQNYGVGSAAALVNQVKTRFRNIWFALLVGVAAGLPNLTVHHSSPRYRDIRLGDVLVCVPDKTTTGVIHYDLVKDTEDGLEVVSRQAETPSIVRAAFRNIRLTEPDPFYKGNLFADYLDQFLERSGKEKFRCRAQQDDQLYEYTNDGDKTIALSCKRDDRDESKRTQVWYGNIGSGNSLMTNSHNRDLKRDTYDLIGLEMEAAGVMNSLPTGVIRGVCDYGDRMKNKDWQPYAAAVAAVYARGVLEAIPPVVTAAAPVSFSRYCTLPSLLTPHFIGRESYLEEIENRFQQSAPGDQRVVLWGLEGTGKTQIALKYAQLQATKISTFWINTRTFSDFVRGLESIMITLKPRGNSFTRKLPLFEEISLLLEETVSQWLIVLDGADDKSILLEQNNALPPLSDLIPRSEKGRILITTTDSRLVGIKDGVLAPAQNGIKVNPFSSTEAAKFLHKSIPEDCHRELGIDDISMLGKLVDLLDCFPIALSQAASQMREDNVPVVEMMESYVAMRNKLDHGASEMFRLPGFVTFQLSYQRLLLSTNAGDSEKSPEAKLLNLISCFDGKRIPRNMLRDIYQQEFGYIKPFTAAIGRLRNLSLVEYAVELDAYWCLSLVQDWAYQQFSNEEKQSYRKMTARALRWAATRVQSRTISLASTATPSKSNQILSQTLKHYSGWNDCPYDESRILGVGTSALVKAVSRKLDFDQGKVYACKIHTREDRWISTGYANLLKEYRNLKHLKHQHVIRVVECFRFEHSLALILDPVGDCTLKEFLDGDAYDETYTFARSATMVQQWFGCLAEGLDYINSQGFTVIDVKPNNIILIEGRVMFIDFGGAVCRHPQIKPFKGKLLCFTPIYAAPEIQGSCQDDVDHIFPMADVFGLGLVYLELLTHELGEDSLYLHVNGPLSGVESQNESIAQPRYHSLSQNTQSRIRWLWYLFTRYTTESAIPSNQDDPDIEEDLIGNISWIKHVCQWCFLMLQPLPQNRSSAENIAQRISLSGLPCFCQHCERKLAPHQRLLPQVRMSPASTMELSSFEPADFDITWEKANEWWAQEFNMESGTLRI